MRTALESDDDRDQIARLLREQASHACMTPPPGLCDRTVFALRQPPTPLEFPRVESSWRSWVTAAAAMIALTVLAVWALRVPNADDTSPRLTPHLSLAPGAGTREPLVRVASFTQPLEREAQALRDDLKRLAESVRGAIPVPQKPGGDHRPINPNS